MSEGGEAKRFWLSSLGFPPLDIVTLADFGYPV
jgi:hypothetical protein